MLAEREGFAEKKRLDEDWRKVFDVMSEGGEMVVISGGVCVVSSGVETKTGVKEEYIRAIIEGLGCVEIPTSHFHLSYL